MKRRKQTVGWRLILVCLVAVGAAIIGYAYIKPFPDPILVPRQLASVHVPARPLAWPGYGQSAIGLPTSGVITTSGAQSALATASTAKIMTALCVLRVKPLQLNQPGPAIAIGPADVASYNSYLSQGGSVVPVNDGEQLSEYQALEAMLLPSANNIADTLARWAFGSTDNYLHYANSYAAQLGLTTFHASDASGFSPATVASAQELTQLGIMALKNPVLATIVKQPSAVVPVAGKINNVNFLLGSHGIVGIKTGNNDADAGAFLFAATQSVSGTPQTIIGTVMGGDSLKTAMESSTALIDSAFANIAPVQAVSPGEITGNYRAAWQPSSVPVRTLDSTRMEAWGGDTVSLQASYDHLSLPMKQGSVVGSLVITSSISKQHYTVPLVLNNNLSTPSWWWRIEHLF